MAILSDEARTLIDEAVAAGNITKCKAGATTKDIKKRVVKRKVAETAKEREEVLKQLLTKREQKGRNY